MQELKKRTNGGFQIGETDRHIGMHLDGIFLGLDTIPKRKWDFLEPEYSHTWRRLSMLILKLTMTVHNGRQGSILLVLRDWKI